MTSNSILEYQLDFSEMEPGGDYCLRLMESSTGSILAEDSAPAINWSEINTVYLAPLRHYISDTFPEPKIQLLGTLLASRMMPTSLLSTLSQYPEISDPASSLRFSLSFSPKLARLASLPWEYSYFGDQHLESGISGYPFLNSHIHLSRRMSQLAPASPIETDCLRVLVAWADPRSSKYAALTHIQAEVENIRSVFSSISRRSDVQVLPHATPLGLKRELEEWQPHVLHFIGHGDILPTGGILVLDGGQPGEVNPVHGDDLAAWVKSARTQLTVLSACWTGAIAGSVATALAGSGTPAVLAMQLPWRDAQAGQFTGEFYRQFCETGSLEKAVAAGRKAIKSAGPEWGVPALYLNFAGSKLFLWNEALLENPFYVPFRNPLNIIGRRELIAEIHESLIGAPSQLTSEKTLHRPVALAGIPGIGKTLTALKYVHEHRSSYPGGVFWVNADTTEHLKEGYTAIGARFFKSEILQNLSSDESAARVCDLLQAQKKPTLIVLDNVSEDTALELLPVVGECRMLVTTRPKWLFGPEANIRNISYGNTDFKVISKLELSQESALEILQSHRKAETTEEQLACIQIAEMLGNLPLPLMLATQNIERLGKTFSAYRAQLPNNLTPLFGSIFDALDVSYRDLPPTLRRTLGTAACFSRRSIPIDLLLKVCDFAPKEEVENALASLADYSLLSRDEPNRITLHESVRVFAQGRLKEEGLISATLEKTAETLTEWLYPVNKRHAWDEARRDIAHCQIVADSCREYGLQLPLFPLLRELGSYQSAHRERNYHHYLEKSFEIAKSHMGMDSIETANIQRMLGEAYQALERHKEASFHVNSAIKTARIHYKSKSADLAVYYNGLGFVFKMQAMYLQKPGYFPKALAYYKKALTNYERSYGKIHSDCAMVQNNIGMLLKENGDVGEALEYLEVAKRIYSDIFGESHPYVAMANNNIGQVLAQMNRHDEALERYDEAIRCFEITFGRNYSSIATSLYYSAESHFSLQHYSEARLLYEEAFRIYSYFYGDTNRRCCTVREKISLLNSLNSC